jgi:branched-chain amino acid transport system ATP-binding protein
VTDLYAGYDGRDYLRGLHLHVAPGETVGVLGTNGAGKSTLLRALSGLLVPRQGRVTFEGRDLRGVPAHEIVRRGIGHVPQGRNMFGDLTAEENIRIGGYTRASRREVEAEIERQYQRWPTLRAFARRRARLLSGGEQELVAIVRALMASPRFLMLDEPSMGLSPVATRDVFGMLKRLGQEYGLSILVVEQNVAAALALADRVYVMAHGEIVAESRADAVTPGELVETYFGRGRAPLSR